MDMTDAHLVQRFVARRDEAAFEELVRRHGPMVLGVCRRVLPGPHDADDAFQATFLVLARKAATLRKRQSVSSWLYGVAVRVAKNLNSSVAARSKHERQAREMPKHDASSETAWEELRPVLDEELDRLPEKYRAPVVLCYLEGKTNQQAARELGWTKGTVSGRLARARDVLRHRLAARGVVLSAGVLATLLTQNAAAAGLPPALVTSTAHAATLIALGEAITTGLISAQAAALTQGMIQAMMIAKMKLAATAMLALALLAGGAGLVAHRALADGPSAPRAKKKPTDGKSAPRPAARSALDKTPATVVKNGLAVTVRPAKASFAKDEPLNFTVTFKNASNKAFLLYDSDFYYDWDFSFRDVKTRGYWQTICMLVFDRVPPPSVVLRPGNTREVKVVLNAAFQFRRRGAKKATRANKQLAPGTYRLTAKVQLRQHPKAHLMDTRFDWWTGEIKTRPVAFKIAAGTAGGKAAVRKAPGQVAVPAKLTRDQIVEAARKIGAKRWKEHLLKTGWREDIFRNAGWTDEQIRKVSQSSALKQDPQVSQTGGYWRIVFENVHAGGGQRVTVTLDPAGKEVGQTRCEQFDY